MLEIKKLKTLQKKYKKKIYCILQLRLNKKLQKIKKYLKNKKNITGNVKYITL